MIKFHELPEKPSYVYRPQYASAIEHFGLETDQTKPYYRLYDHP